MHKKNAWKKSCVFPMKCVRIFSIPFTLCEQSLNPEYSLKWKNALTISLKRYVKCNPDRLSSITGLRLWPGQGESSVTVTPAIVRFMCGYCILMTSVFSTLFQCFRLLYYLKTWRLSEHVCNGVRPRSHLSVWGKPDETIIKTYGRPADTASALSLPCVTW